MLHVDQAVETARRLHQDLAGLRKQIADEAGKTLENWTPAIIRSEFLPSAVNLAHYLAFRRADLRQMQDGLSLLGLSSLGRCESRVLPAIDSVLAALARIAGIEGQAYPEQNAWVAGSELLLARQSSIFGSDPDGPCTRIMATLPTEAAMEPELVRKLVANGTDCMRINCAHDSADEWEKMVRHIRAAAAELKRDVRIDMDLGGPKIRIERVNKQAKERLMRGDRFMLTDEISEKSGFAEATLSYETLLDRLAPGDYVWINDGKIGARVIEKDGRQVMLKIFSAREKGEKLKPEKGVNLPGAEIAIPALTDEDIGNLDFAAQHADIIGFSFVQTPDDVRALNSELQKRCKTDKLPALMLKIETKLAVRNLPRLIVQAGGCMPVAVMIARGDLAVEIGLERLSEVQEEILWICEAAHVPVVWATQVLDSMVHDGAPTRAEATDAAMSQRAECVMLNKGPHLAEAVEFLDRVLRRMDRHQSKKSARLGPLGSWREPQLL
ncbi:MAG: pyruvate kinase [Rhizobiaceae bacterium]